MKIVLSLIFGLFISVAFTQPNINLTGGSRGLEGGLEIPLNKKDNVKNFIGFRYGITAFDFIDDNGIKFRYGFNSAVTYKHKLWKWGFEYEGITGLKEREIIQFFIGSSLGVNYGQNRIYVGDNGWDPYLTFDMNLNLLFFDFKKFDLRGMLEVNYGFDYNHDSSKPISFLRMGQLGLQFIINKEKK